MRNSQYPFLIVSYFSANSLRHCLANWGFFCAFISARTSSAWILTLGTSSGEAAVESVAGGLMVMFPVDLVMSYSEGTNSFAKDSIEDNGLFAFFNTLQLTFTVSTIG